MRNCRPHRFSLFAFAKRAMNPLVNVHYPTNTDADLDRLQQLAEQLSGFDERVSLEWLDGAMTALAAGPRPTTVAAWRDALLGEAWSRAFADPEADRAANAVLETRWRVLVKQLDPELLMDAMDELRLAPVMLEWSDDDKAKLVEDGTIAAGEEDDEIPLTGEIWAHGFMDVVQSFTDDWPEPDVETEMGQAFDECTMRIVMLTIHDPEELAKVREELYPGEQLTREDLIQEALYAAQDLRCYWVQNAPKPETRRVEALPGRNDPCHCGSGKKFKKCHGQ
jgi:uncharacterized protein